MSLGKSTKKIVKDFLPKSSLVYAHNFRFRNLPKIILAPAKNRSYLAKLKNVDLDAKADKNAIYKLFKDVPDDFWFWLYTYGYTQSSDLREIMPSLPDEHLQLQFTGVSGDKTLQEAFLFYQFIKSNCAKNGVVIGNESKILDFGCGWGRVIRFFLRDTPRSNLFGIDCDEEIIKVCEDSNINCNFSVNAIYPPTEFQDDVFDVIYSFSVFSHLSEDAHIRWLAEFKRILKPGGVLVVTTRSRDFIISSSRVRELTESELPFYAKGTADSFLDTSKSLLEYDNGKFVYEAVGGGGVRDGSFYGETCIPQKYVERVWSKYFSSLDFISYKKHKSFNQNAIICRK
jgi:SAM-dependent methyltransferase